MTLGNMHLVVLRMSYQTQVDPALVDTVAIQLSKYKIENEPALYTLSAASVVGGSYFSFGRILAPFAQCVIPILCSGLNALCRVDMSSFHSMY